MEKLFGTDGIRGTANIYPLTPELILNIGKAVAVYARSISNLQKPKIVIGKDTRLSGYMFETALTSGIVSQGCDVLLVGPMPTPAIAHLTKSLNCSAGIVLSASHNPAKDNGIKIFDSHGCKISEIEEQKIESLALNPVFDSKLFVGKKLGKAFRIDDAKGRYIEFVKSSIQNASLSGLKIVVDCANGAAYNIAGSVFSELGAEVKVINKKPNGMNINKNCGALFPQELQVKVKETKADLGIALDGDADRIVVCDDYGKILDGDDLAFIFSNYLNKIQTLAQNTAVVTEMSNFGLDLSLKKHGIKVVRVPVGDKFVMRAMQENKYSFGCEQSGHIIFSDYSTTGDGIISGLQLAHILVSEKKKVSELLNDFERIPQVLLNVKVAQRIPLTQLKKTSQLIQEFSEALKNQGRVLVRYSGTEYLARILVEGKNKKQIQEFANQIAKTLKSEVSV
ncbi:MAG: phosphoglucosamine mutase [Candidatus Diapherotrites archaeon]|nr:phosphoglucosamine mutase [Candidatus Diapherotrites archaeon]